MSETAAAAMPAPAATEPEEVRVLSFNVGHGDCTLIEYIIGSQPRFRCLVDAGKALPPDLLEHLRTNRPADSSYDIDVLVLSHVDHDHQGGLPTLVAAHDVTIGEYLGPCLPTFRRLAWLFAPRVQAAVEKASDLEHELIARRIPVVYPLEGYKRRHADGRVVLSVISPAARLLRALSVNHGTRLSTLLSRQPLLLQWLLEADALPVDDDDEEAIGRLFDTRVSLTPDDFTGGLRRPRDVDANDIIRAAAEKTSEFEPDFFGNQVLNDTSLVVVLDVHLGGSQRKRILLTGDQENWTYICAQHPVGLGVDVLKAPHHGGRVYLSDCREDFDGLYAWLRPKTVVVSASGQHHLPRIGFRDTLRRVGSTLLCPNQRGIEPLSAGMTAKPGEQSCFYAMGCKRPNTRSSTCVTLRADGEFADAVACVQGFGHSGVSPIVVLRQDVTSPSESIVRYTQGELEKHAKWISRQLEDEHVAFQKRAGTFKADEEWAMRAEQAPVSLRAILAHAKDTGRHDLANDPTPVLNYARSHRLFWASAAVRHWDTDELKLYRLPRDREVDELRNWFKKVPRILLRGQLDARDVMTCHPIDMLRQADWRVVAGLAAAHLAVPPEVVTDDVLPRVWLDIANRYSLRVCNWQDPKREFSDGNAYFLLEQPERLSHFPNVEHTCWMAVWRWGKAMPKAPWRRLRTLASRGLLAGNFFQRENPFGRLWMSGWRDHWNNEQPIGEAILQAKWRDMWKLHR